jgi:HSP20 family protein
LGQLSGFGAAWPNVEISETNDQVKVTAEIAGLDEKDIEVLLDDAMLTLRGEKRSETDDKDRQFSERFYGRFERRIPLRYEVEQDKVAASFKVACLP